MISLIFAVKLNTQNHLTLFYAFKTGWEVEIDVVYDNRLIHRTFYIEEIGNRIDKVSFRVFSFFLAAISVLPFAHYKSNVNSNVAFLFSLAKRNKLYKILQRLCKWGSRGGGICHP